MADLQHPLVMIVWHDAHTEPTSSNTWFDHETIGPEPYPIISVGHLLPPVKPDHCSIAQSVATNDGLVDSVLHIPRGMIVRSRFLNTQENEDEI